MTGMLPMTRARVFCPRNTVNGGTFAPMSTVSSPWANTAPTGIFRSRQATRSRCGDVRADSLCAAGPVCNRSFPTIGVNVTTGDACTGVSPGCNREARDSPGPLGLSDNEFV